MADKKSATSGREVAGNGPNSFGVSVLPQSLHQNGHFGNGDLDQALDAAFTPADQNQAEAQAAAAEKALLSEGAHDEGNARCVNLRHNGRFVYTEALGWLHYTGSHWSTTGAEAAVDRAIVETLTARAQAGLKADPEVHSKLIKFCIPNKTRVQGAKYLLESLVTASEKQFDTEPDLLNCRNGVLDLRTGELQPHSPEQRFTFCTSVAYKPDARSKAWETWLLGAVGSQEIADWLQLAVGYSLTGHTREEVLFYLYGPPRAGKGVFSEALLKLLGSPLAKEVNFGTFTAQRTGDSQNFDLAPLKASRLIAASESNSYERFNEAKVKALTGGNEVWCAFKHKSHFNYRPQYKIWLSSNLPANADPDDDAVWGRLRVIEFPTSHLGKENKLLKSRLHSEAVLEGLLAWAVRGAVQWYQLGASGLPELESSAMLKEQQREDLDNVQAWLGECATRDKDAFSANAQIYKSYEAWCKDNGVSPKSQKGLTQALVRKGFQRKKERAGAEQKVKRGFKGFRVDT